MRANAKTYVGRLRGSAAVALSIFDLYMNSDSCVARVGSSIMRLGRLVHCSPTVRSTTAGIKTAGRRPAPHRTTSHRTAYTHTHPIKGTWESVSGTKCAQRSHTLTTHPPTGRQHTCITHRSLRAQAALLTHNTLAVHGRCVYNVGTKLMRCYKAFNPSSRTHTHSHTDTLICG